MTRGACPHAIWLAPGVLREVLANGLGVQRTRYAQRPGERLAPLREAQASQIPVQGRTATWRATGGVRDEYVPDRYDT